jgi:hypothetical protein
LIHRQTDGEEKPGIRRYAAIAAKALAPAADRVDHSARSH